MKYESLVSVILPYYKKKDFILNTLNSIYAQTYKNIEIIIIYDDENKKELFFLKKHLKKKLVKLIINKKNLGAALSRNKGIKESNGEFIAFIDGDDVWKKNKLQYQIDMMKKRNLCFTHTSYTIVNKSLKKIKDRVAKQKTDYNDLLKS